MTFDEYTKPQPVVSERKPWDQVLEEFAVRNGRPLWPVERFRYQGRHAQRSDGEASPKSKRPRPVDEMLATLQTSMIDEMLAALRTRKTGAA